MIIIFIVHACTLFFIVHARTLYHYYNLILILLKSLETGIHLSYTLPTQLPPLFERQLR